MEHHKARKSLGASLWKQASSDDLLALLNSDRMLQTIAHFPQQRNMLLEVVVMPHVYPVEKKTMFIVDIKKKNKGCQSIIF